MSALPPAIRDVPRLKFRKSRIADGQVMIKMHHLGHAPLLPTGHIRVEIVDL